MNHYRTVELLNHHFPNEVVENQLDFSSRNKNTDKILSPFLLVQKCYCSHSAALVQPLHGQQDEWSLFPFFSQFSFMSLSLSICCHSFFFCFPLLDYHYLAFLSPFPVSRLVFTLTWRLVFTLTKTPWRRKPVCKHGEKEREREGYADVFTNSTLFFSDEGKEGITLWNEDKWHIYFPLCHFSFLSCLLSLPLPHIAFPFLFTCFISPTV